VALYCGNQSPWCSANEKRIYSLVEWLIPTILLASLSGFFHFKNVFSILLFYIMKLCLVFFFFEYFIEESLFVVKILVPSILASILAKIVCNMKQLSNFQFIIYPFFIKN